MCAAQGETGTHVAGMQPAHPRTVVAEMRVYAIGIQQTMGQQLEHGDLAVVGTVSMPKRQQVADRKSHIVPATD